MMFPGRVCSVADSPSPEPTADEVASSSLVTPTKSLLKMMFPGRVCSVADSPSPEPTADEVASSSLVTPTKLVIIIGEILLSQ